MWLPANLPQPAHVIGMWSLEEGDNEIRRSSLDTNHFSNIYGDVLCVPGAINNAIKVTSRGDYLATIGNNPELTRVMTLSFKAKFLEEPGASQSSLVIGKFNTLDGYPDPGTVEDASWVFTIVYDNEVYNKYQISFMGWEANDDWYIKIWNVNTNFDHDIWYKIMLILRWQGNDYPDGHLWAALAINPYLSTSELISLGEIKDLQSVAYPIKVGLFPLGGYTNNFATKVDELIIWDTALTDDEINTLFSLDYKSMQCESVSGGGGAYII